MTNLAIIPARGGSKRIPGKNIRPFLGKPIIAYSIEAALESGLFGTVMVSTDDKAVAETARQYGAEVPFLRSVATADDHATLADVVDEVLKEFEHRGNSIGFVCCILPTAPLVSPELLKKGLQLLEESGADSMRPVARFSYPVQRAFSLHDGALEMLYPEYRTTRSQDLEPAYHDAGQFYWMRPGQGMRGDKRFGFEIPQRLVQDIDEEADWEMAEMKYLAAEEKRSGTYIIAELSANHNNDFDLAVRTVEAMAEAGADAVKVQTYRPQSLTIDLDSGYFAPHTAGLWKGYTPWQLFSEAAMPYDWQPKLKQVAEALGLDFFSSPFDREGVDFLAAMDVPHYKIASFEITDTPLIEYTASMGKPMIISTGLADEEDIQRAIDACRRAGNDQITLLKCTSQYPATIDAANLVTITDMKRRFGVEVGLSDHTMGSLLPTVAVSLGATVVEKHFILDRQLGGPDAAFSMEPEEFKAMVEAVRQTEAALGRVTYEVTERDRVRRRSLFVVAEMKAGETVTGENVRSIRPGYGMHPQELKNVLGRRMKRDVARGTPFTEDLLEKQRLEAAADDNYDDYYMIRSEKKNLHWTGYEQPPEYEGFKKWYAGRISDPERDIYLLYVDGQCAGSLHIDFYPSYAIIGYNIKEAFEGRGYGTLLAGKAVEIAQQEKRAGRKDLKEVRAWINALNSASVSVVERNGFRNTGVSEERIRFSKKETYYIYALELE